MRTRNKLTGRNTDEHENFNEMNVKTKDDAVQKRKTIDKEKWIHTMIIVMKEKIKNEWHFSLLEIKLKNRNLKIINVKYVRFTFFD